MAHPTSLFSGLPEDPAGLREQVTRLIEDAFDRNPNAPSEAAFVDFWTSLGEDVLTCKLDWQVAREVFEDYVMDRFMAKKKGEVV